MARLPDRFDLQIRKARLCTDPIRQADYVLGALVGLSEWHFFNLGTRETPQAARTEIDTDPYILVYSTPDRIADFLREQGPPARDRNSLPVISVAMEAAMAWCVECRVGLFVNPPEEAVMIPFGQLQHFHTEWQKRSASPTGGFWIPNMTSEEEDFWQEQGL
jgi:hypothetical protein